MANKLFGEAASNIKSVDFTNSKIETFTATAFTGCIELQKITFGETVKNIVSDTLNGCTNLKQIIFEGENPPTIENQGVSMDNIIIEVPEGKEQTYQDALDVDNPGATVTAEEDILRYTSTSSLLSNQWLFDENGGVAAKWSETEVYEIIDEELWARFSWSGKYKGEPVSGTFDARIGKNNYEGILDNITGTEVFTAVGKDNELLVYADKEQSSLMFTIQPYSEISENTEYTDQGYTYSFVNVEKPVYSKEPTYEGVVVLNNEVDGVAAQAFYNDSTLTSIKLPQQITSIGVSAFSGCSELTSIDFPNSLTTIENSAFYNCSSLTSIEIPSSVTAIIAEAFSGCVELASIVVASNNNSFDSRNNCNAIIKTSKNALIVGCKNTIIPNSVTDIGGSAFYGCSGLTSINIPDSVTGIGWSAFNECSGLTSIIIPNSVTSIGDMAFYKCSNVSNVTCNATTPPSLSSKGDTFSGITTTNCIVPEGSEQSYFNSYWALNFETFNGKYPDPYDPDPYDPDPYDLDPYDPYGY